MKRNAAFPLVVLLMTLAAGWLINRLSDQGRTVAQEPSATPGIVLDTAVVNVAKALREHSRFQRDMASLKTELGKFQQEVAVRQAELESVVRDLQKLQPGTPLREKKQLLLVRLQKELKELVDRNRQQLLAEEAVLYKQAYEEIRDAVSRYAADNGIRLVLRVNNGEIDARNPKAVQEAVNQPVLYHSGLDITDKITEELAANDQAQ